MTTANRWYVRASGPKIGDKPDQEGHERFSMPTVLYEVDPADGEVLRQIDTHDVPPSSIACVNSAQFTAFQYEASINKFDRLEAEVEP